MIQVVEVGFCVYPVTDIDRAREFYEGALGLKPTTSVGRENRVYVEYEFGPYALAIGCWPVFKPSPDGCVAALEVADFDQAIAHLRERNVKFRIEPMQTPVCRMAMVFDPDGNTICIHKRNAK